MTEGEPRGTRLIKDVHQFFHICVNFDLKTPVKPVLEYANSGYVEVRMTENDRFLLRILSPKETCELDSPTKLVAEFCGYGVLLETTASAYLCFVPRGEHALEVNFYYDKKMTRLKLKIILMERNYVYSLLDNPNCIGEERSIKPLDFRCVG